MKKYILSTFVILTFGTYVLFQKMTGTGNVITAIASKNSAATTPANTKNPSSVPTTKINVPTTTPAKNIISGLYKDGEYTGQSANAYYGNVQVKAVISDGKLTDVKFLDYPQDRNTSVRINNYAMPILRSEAIQAQNASVNAVSGATHTSGAFKKSLQSALSLAQNS